MTEDTHTHSVYYYLLIHNSEPQQDCDKWSSRPMRS